MMWNYGGLFIFLFLSTLLVENILAYDRNRNNKKSLIFSTFPATFEEYIYKFDGVFEQWRFKQFQTIIKDKGSVQSNDTMEYEEFLALMEFLNEYNEGKNVEKIMAEMLPWNGENEKEKIDVEYLVKFVKEFREAYDVLDEQIQNFVEKFPTIKNVQQYMEDIDLLIECKKFMRFLMSEESKKGSRMANAGSWLDIFSFMNSGNEIFSPLKQIFECSKVQNASLDERINEELYEEHKSNRFKQKKIRFAQQDGDENQRQLDARINPLERAVIEGAGPNGLMATFHLFLSGMRVLLVNDRPKKYIRSRIFLLDAKWMSQLRFFLGTMFDELFVGDQALADVNLGDVGFINCRNLEQKMWERLEALAEFMQRMETNDEKILELRSETLFNEKIEFPKEGKTKFFATFSTPTRLGNPDAGKENANKIKNELAPIIFNKKIKKCGGKITEEIKEKLRKESLKEAKQNMLDGILKNLLKVLSEMYRRKVGWYEKILEYQPDGRDGEKKKLNAKEWAKLELEGKVLQLKVHKKMQVDLMVCAGGAKDRIRDKYLGNAQLRIVPTNYAVFVLEKGKIDDKIFPQRTIFLDDTTMNDLKPFLDERNWNELIEQNDVLSKELRQKYKNMSELMTKTLIPKEVEEGQKKSPLNKEYKLDENGHFIVDKDEGKKVGQPLRIFENKESVLITSVPPFPLEEFLKELEKEKNSKPINVRPKYANLRKRLERIWSAAIYDLSIEKIVRDKMQTHKLNLSKTGELIEEEEGENGQKPAVYFNEYPVNTAIFQQTVLSVKNPVKELIMPEEKSPPSSSVIILAVGDANSNQHSLTASGLSTGRIGSEHIAYLIRDYHRGKINRQQLVEELRTSQNSVKERVLNRAMEFANLLPEEEDL